MTWHADAAQLAGYAGGELDPARAASVEAHLLDCPACQAGVAGAVPRDRLERIWRGVAEVVDGPRPGPVERLLARLGVPGHTARLLAAAPSLHLSWFAAVAAALGFAVVAAHGGRSGPLLFLLLAPLLPVAGVAAAYGPGIDPTHELAVAAPMPGSRLLLLRAAAVLASTTLLAATAALALPDLGWLAAAWLLPALGLTLASLALATALHPAAAAGTVAFAWVVAVGATQWAAVRHLRDPFAAPVASALFDPAGQLAFLALAVLAALLLARRSDRFDLEPSRRQP
jgi:putative zinc finger protein